MFLPISKSHIDWHMTYFDTSASYIEIESENHNIQKICLTFLKNEIWLAGVFSGEKNRRCLFGNRIFQWTVDTCLHCQSSRSSDCLNLRKSNQEIFWADKFSRLSESYWEFPMVKTVWNASDFYKDTFKIINSNIYLIIWDKKSFKCFIIYINIFKLWEISNVFTKLQD